MGDLLVIAAVVVLGMVFGTIAERRHYKSIREREGKWAPVPATNFAHVPPGSVERVELACGSSVVASDGLKNFLGPLLSLVGGELNMYSSVIDRARREAVLRMKESCPWADCFVNLRMETSQVDGESPNASVMVYATALSFSAK